MMMQFMEQLIDLKEDLLENMELQLGYFKQLGQLHLYTPAAEM